MSTKISRTFSRNYNYSVDVFAEIRDILYGIENEESLSKDEKFRMASDALNKCKYIKKLIHKLDLKEVKKKVSPALYDKINQNISIIKEDLPRMEDDLDSQVLYEQLVDSLTKFYFSGDSYVITKNKRIYASTPRELSRKFATALLQDKTKLRTDINSMIKGKTSRPRFIQLFNIYSDDMPKSRPHKPDSTNTAFESFNDFLCY